MSESQHFDKTGKYKLDAEKLKMYDEKMRKLLIKSIDLKEASERGEDSNYDESTSIIQKSEEVLEITKYSSTAYLDAKILNTTAIMYKNSMEAMDSRLSEFKPMEFADNVVSYLNNKGGGRNIWDVLRKEATMAFSNTGGWTWMLGSIDKDRPDEKRTANVQHPRIEKANVVNAPLKNPKKVQQLDKEEEDLEERMQEIMVIICKWERENKELLQYWDLVLHPTSFSQTVENMFYVSHLVKEDLVYLSQDKDGLPTIQKAKNYAAIKEGGVSDRHAIAITIDMEEWKSLVDAFEIEEPMIPTRKYK